MFAVNLAQLVQEYGHRLLTLDVSLQEMARRRQINPVQYQKRAKEVQRLQLVLAELRRMTEQPKTQQDMLFKAPENMTPDEIDVCSAYLQQKRKLLKGAAKEMRRLQRWLTEVVSGRCGGWVLILRLSRLRYRLSSLEAALSKTTAEQQIVDEYVNRFARSFPHVSGASDREETIAVLTRLYNEIEAATAKLANLKLDHDQQMAELKTKERWLHEQEQYLKLPPPVHLLPSPVDLMQAINVVGQFASRFVDRRVLTPKGLYQYR